MADISSAKERQGLLFLYPSQGLPVTPSHIHMRNSMTSYTFNYHSMKNVRMHKWLQWNYINHMYSRQMVLIGLQPFEGLRRVNIDQALSKC